MKPKMKKVVLLLGGSGAALVLAAVIFVLTFDINSYKTSIEAAASTASRMQVRINGKMKLSLFPVPRILIEDILLQNKDTDVASIKNAEMEIRLLPLLRRKVLIRQARLVAPSFFITKDKRGRFNLERDKKKPFEIKKIIIQGGHARYLDEITGRKAEAKDCDLSIRNLSSSGEGSFEALSFDGDLSCKDVMSQDLRISDARVEMKAHGGKFEATPFSMKIFGGDCKGTIKGVMTGESREYAIDFAITKFRFEEVLGAFNQKQSVHGELDLKSHLAMKGKDTKTVRGDVSLRGHNLSLKSLDIDAMLQKYEKSQNFNLVDLGAFFIVGPLGAVLTKGYDFGSAYKESLGGESEILKLVSDWKVVNGIAQADDVAFITRKNRVALNGKLDFVHNRFEDVTVAVLNAKGCATHIQKIHGSFNKPKIDKPNIFRSLMGPVISLVTKSYDMLKGGKCEVFYGGSLAQP